MTPDDARFLRNLRSTLHDLSTVRLYWIADALAAELAIRGADCEPEARALVAALLAEAGARRRAIYSADCGLAPES